MPKIKVDGHTLTLEAVHSVSYGQKVELDEQAAQRVDRARTWIEQLVSAGDKAPAVYGINTGFGSLKSTHFSISEARLVSRNLIISHAAGVGELLPIEIVRAAMLLRANSLAQGHSGVRREIVNTLLEMLNHGVTPAVPSQGSLGASGDLAPLSHIALVLCRDPEEDREEVSGQAWFEGKLISGKEAMKLAGLERLVLEAKEGLALNNGVQVMTALAVHTLLRAEKLTKLHDIALSLHIEGACGVRSAFDSRISGLRKYHGQAIVANNVLNLLENSTIADSDKSRVQDAYSVRCAPQIAGAVRDGLAHIRRTLEIEINSVTDNPLIFPEQGESLSGGNFHGDPVGLPVDYMKTLLCELGNISERRISRLMDRKLNYDLPPYLAQNAGIDSGLMIASYTAAGLASENKVLAHPASVDTIPTSEDQEDVVSMGTHGARQAMQILGHVETIVAIELLCAVQAVTLRLAKMPNHKLGKGSQTAYDFIRKEIPPFEKDRLLSIDIEKALKIVREGKLLEIVSKIVQIT